MCLRIVTDNVKFKTAEEDMTFYKVYGRPGTKYEKLAEERFARHE